MSVFSNLLESARVILYHKQSTSAMTRFFKLDAGGVVLGEGLPQLSRIVTGETVVAGDSVLPHPAAIAGGLAHWLGLESGDLEVESNFQELVEVPGDTLRVYLARFTTIDPPFAEAERVQASFIPLTQARGLPPVELELLRAAYTMIMEG